MCTPAWLLPWDAEDTCSPMVSPPFDRPTALQCQLEEQYKEVIRTSMPSFLIVVDTHQTPEMRGMDLEDGDTWRELMQRCDAVDIE